MARKYGNALTEHLWHIGNKRAMKLDALGLSIFQSQLGELVENWEQLPGANGGLVIDAGADDAALLLAYTALNKNFELLGVQPIARHIASGIEIATCVIAGSPADADTAIIAPHLDVATVDAVANTPQSRWSCGKWVSENQLQFLSRFRVAKIKNITTASRSTTTASITTDLPHNLSIGQSVTVALLTGPTGYTALNGTYVVTGLTSNVVFTYTTTTSGTVSSGAATGTVTPNDIKLQTIWTGLKKTNVSAIATDNDQFYMRYLPTENSGKMQIITSRGGTDKTTVLPITVQPNTVYNIWFRIDANRIPSVVVNGKVYYLKGTNGETGDDGSAALVAGVSLIPYTGTSANGTTPGRKALDILSGYTIRGLEKYAA